MLPEVCVDRVGGGVGESRGGRRTDEETKGFWRGASLAIVFYPRFLVWLAWAFWWYSRPIRSRCGFGDRNKRVCSQIGCRCKTVSPCRPHCRDTRIDVSLQVELRVSVETGDSGRWNVGSALSSLAVDGSVPFPSSRESLAYPQGHPCLY